MKKKQVITFASTHQALKAEDIFKKKELIFELIPTPREISAECGFALLVSNSNDCRLSEFCRREKISFADIYDLKIEKGVKSYEKSD